MPGTIRTQRDGRVATVVFDHPERRNAVSNAMWGALADTLRELRADSDVRCVVLRGAGQQAFVSGADISELGGTTGYGEDVGRAMIELATFDKPLLAMIHGHCVGGGVAIALTADVRYAAESASFCIPAARLGIGYPMEGVAALAELVGLSVAKDMLFTARKLRAPEALRVGLVNAVVADGELDAHVAQAAASIVENAPLTIAAVKKAGLELVRPAEQRDLAGVGAAVGACFSSDDLREGVTAFLEKRKPLFSGR